MAKRLGACMSQLINRHKEHSAPKYFLSAAHVFLFGLGAPHESKDSKDFLSPNYPKHFGAKLWLSMFYLQILKTFVLLNVRQHVSIQSGSLLQDFHFELGQLFETLCTLLRSTLRLGNLQKSVRKIPPTLSSSSPLVSNITRPGCFWQKKNTSAWIPS